MHIQSFELLQGVHSASGLTVIIDVFRSASVACYAFAGGAKEILPVASLDEGRSLKREHPDYLLIGEQECLLPDGFDYGNSPSEIRAQDVAGRTLIHATSAGTPGLNAAMGVSDRVLFCSFPNIGATAAAVTAAAPETVSIVAMGKAGTGHAPEDKLCAMCLGNILEGVPNIYETIPRFLRGHPTAEIFFGPTGIVPEEDFAMCLEPDTFDFFIEAKRLDDGRLSLSPFTQNGSTATPFGATK